MRISEWITAVIAFAAAGIMILLAVRHWAERGTLLNNAFLYASDEERKTMDKKPYYRQSAVVFFVLSAVCIVIGLSVLLQNSRINLLEIPLLLGAAVYAVTSSARIRKNKKNP